MQAGAVNANVFALGNADLARHTSLIRHCNCQLSLSARHTNKTYRSYSLITSAAPAQTARKRGHPELVLPAYHNSLFAALSCPQKGMTVIPVPTFGRANAGIQSLKKQSAVPDKGRWLLGKGKTSFHVKRGFPLPQTPTLFKKSEIFLK